MAILSHFIIRNILPFFLLLSFLISGHLDVQQPFLARLKLRHDTETMEGHVLANALVPRVGQIISVMLEIITFGALTVCISRFSTFGATSKE